MLLELALLSQLAFSDPLYKDKQFCTVEIFLHDGKERAEGNSWCEKYTLKVDGSKISLFGYNSKITIPLWSGWGFGDYVVVYTFGESKARIAGGYLNGKWVEAIVEEVL